MNNESLINLLQEIPNAKKVYRNHAASLVLEDTELLEPLIKLTFDSKNNISIKAAWVLEWICIHKDLSKLYPFLDFFTENLKYLEFDSAIRPCAKICETLGKSYQKRNQNSIKTYLKETHIDAIIETGFQWLITPQKTAVRAYIMNALFLFGKHRDWVHEELAHLIKTKIIHESKGTKARGKQVLQLIEKHQNSHS